MSSDDEDFRRAMALSLGRDVPDPESDDDGAAEDMMREALERTSHIQPPSNYEFNGPGFGARRDDDDELQRALALSMQHGGGADDPIDLVEDGDDEIRRAVKMSLEDDERRRKAKEAQVPELTEEEQMELAIQASLAEAEPGAKNIGGLEDDVDSETEDQFFNELNRTLKESRAGERLAAAAAAAERATRSGSAAATATVPAAGPSSAVASSSSVQPTQIPSSAKPAPNPTAQVSKAVPKISTGMPSRAEMEKERLARQRRLQGLDPDADGEPEAKKQKVSIIPAAPPVRVKGMGDLSETGTGSGAAAGSSSGSVYKAGASSNMRGASSSSSSTSSSRPHPYQTPNPPHDAAGEYFLDGELRHTHLDVGSKSKDPVWYIADAMGKREQMTLLIMSSYDWDFDFMLPHFPHPEDCPIAIVRPPNQSSPEMIAQTNGKAVEMQEGLAEVYPPMLPSNYGPGLMGSCHMKYAWIFYKTGRLRVIISSANFVERDWRLIENTVFVQDFLPLQTPQELSADRPEHDMPLQFRDLFTHIKLGRVLSRFASRREIPLRSINNWESMARWDWSRVKVKMIMSIPGKWQGKDAGRYGFARLGEVVKAAGWGKGKDERVVADFQSSSLGKFTIGWFTDFYNALGGMSAEKLSQMRKATKKDEWPPFKVVFPSLKTVQASELGKNGGGTMFVGTSWEAATKPLFHDSNSQRGGVLLHAKALTAIYEARPNTLGVTKTASSSKGKGKRTHEELEDDPDVSKVGGWVYIGSANFSPSAWGKISGTHGEAVVNLNNYEMGIILPLPREGADAAATRIVPHQRPPRRYAMTDVPWDQKEMLK